MSAGTPRWSEDFAGLIAYDLTTGDATVLANRSSDGSPMGSGVELLAPRGIALDEPRGALLVFDAELDAIVSVDLDTLARTVLVDASTGHGDHLTSTWSDDNAISLDGERRVLYATNERTGEVVAVDLVTGDQAVIAR